MFIIKYFPEFVSHLILFIGIAGVMFTSIPVLWKIIPGSKMEQLPLQLVSICILCFGIYLEGGQAEARIWKEEMAILQKKVDIAEEKAKKVNTIIVTEYVDKIKVVRKQGESITKYIDREVVKYDKSCPIPDSVIISHNAAAKNESLEEKK
jgi:hypothetical protein